MINKRRDFIKTSAIAGVGLGISGSLAAMNSGSGVAPGGRVGIIGLDTSHVVAFTNTINKGNEEGNPDYKGFQVVAAYPTKGSADLPSSIDRLAGFTERVGGMGVEIVDSIDELLEKTDVILLESVDGRRHIEEALPVFKAGKRMFIDKPVSNNLAGAIAIFELSKKYNVPVFSCSTTRFAPETLAIVNGKDSVGKVLNAYTFGPAGTIVGHIDMSWYGIHGIESLFTFMGSGCKEVTRFKTSVSDTLAGTWEDGRVGVYNSIPQGGKGGFGGTVFGDKGVEEKIKILAGYDPMLVEIVKYFRTGILPLEPENTLEMFAFMEAADVSKMNGGKPVSLASVMEKAKVEAKKLI
ncbi:MAG: twin-arginine translocation signal domain-containing protein [Prolixibacteraceae bacterium]|nr:twin-arginine translocation signal domain-containing protein [Prolixibacteraceae bacterium]